MAEIKTGIFAKNVQKRLSRAQEKVRRSRECNGGTSTVYRGIAHAERVFAIGAEMLWCSGGSCPA